MARVNRTTGFFLILGVAALIVSVTGVNMIMQNSGSSASASPDDDRRPVVLDVVCTGKADVPAGLLTLTPIVPGLVVELDVREGEDVKANQKLLRVNDTEAQAKLAQARFQLNEAKSARENLKLTINERKATLEDLGRQVDAAKKAWTYAYQARVQTEELVKVSTTSLQVTQAKAKEDA